MNDKDRHMETNDPFKQLFRESAMERAPENLIPDVMKTIGTPSVTTAASRPLITRTGWTFIALGLLALWVLSTLPIGTTDEAGESLIPENWITSLQFSIPEFPQIPQTAWLSALAFGLFALLHLYWMKRHLTRQGLM
jgi:hypothetical protein